jgi:hypothetical protein
LLEVSAKFPSVAQGYFDEDNGRIILSVPANDLGKLPQTNPSSDKKGTRKEGKNLNVGGSGGFQVTTCQVTGKTVSGQDATGRMSLAVNCTIPNPEFTGQYAD